MLKNILKVGKALNKQKLQQINGGMKKRRNNCAFLAVYSGEGDCPPIGNYNGTVLDHCTCCYN